MIKKISFFDLTCSEPHVKNCQLKKKNESRNTGKSVRQFVIMKMEIGK